MIHVKQGKPVQNRKGEMKMSYEKVKSIKFDKNTKQVFITSACNNVRPLHFTKWECNGYSKTWQENGYDAMFGALLDDINGGNLKFYSGKFKDFSRYTHREDVRSKYPELNWDWIGDTCKKELKQPDFNEWRKENPDKGWKEYEETDMFKEWNNLWGVKLEIRRSKLLECWKDFEKDSTPVQNADFNFQDLVNHLDTYKTMLWNGKKIRAFYHGMYDTICQYAGKSRSRGYAIIVEASKRFNDYKNTVGLA